ncbi:MAG: hypothetical protein LBD30_02420 [Verrucomicrobiales bacterium]|jgi:hypothetical protein|nr:hypothetical protein [Verrucomicrobiales bacterium]
MSLLRVIGAFLLFIILGIISGGALIGKILGALFSPPKPPPRPVKRSESTRPPSASTTVIEVEVIRIRNSE